MSYIRTFLVVFGALSVCSFAQAETFYVDFTNGTSSGSGSSDSPWDTITTALDNVADGSTVLVRPGTFTGRIRIRGDFAQGVTVKAEIPYKTKLRNSGTVITAYASTRGCRGITIEGFDIAHIGAGAAALVVHIDGNGDGSVSNITLRNNILHDSHNNDVLKINNATHDILVTGNMFYNQSGTDEHIDANSVDNVTIQDNIFFNDFAGSARTNNNDTSSFIVIKDSNTTSDAYTGSRNVKVRRNVFFNWEGSSGSNFILVGEDGTSTYEAFDITIENNLLIGNSSNVMRAPFGVKGGKNITFRNNTITGNLPSLAFGMRINVEGSNPANDNIYFYNNIWNDPSGSMGATTDSSANDFSDTNPSHILNFSILNNLYWNGTAAIPQDSSELINYTDDSSRIIDDPLLPSTNNIAIPRWISAESRFGDGSTTIREAFLNLVASYGTPNNTSPAIDAARTDVAPADDILGNVRPVNTSGDIGAVEVAISTPELSPPTGLRITSSNNSTSASIK